MTRSRRPATSSSADVTHRVGGGATRTSPALPSLATAVTIGALIVVAITVGTVLALGSSPYVLLSRGVPGLATSLTSAVLWAVVQGASIATVGGLVVALVVLPRRADKGAVVPNSPELRIVRWASAIWALAAGALVLVDGADASGQPLGRLAEPGAAATFLGGNYLPGAWMVVFVLAAGIFIVTNLTRRWPNLTAATLLSLVATLPPVLVTQVLVGPNHDFGGDAAILGMPLGILATGVLVVVAVRRMLGRGFPAAAARRTRGVVLVALGVRAGADLIIMFFETAGRAPWESVTGGLFLVRLGLVGALAVITVRMTRQGAGRVAVFAAIPITGVVAGVFVAMSRIPPPQYFVPTSVMQLFLGFNVDTTPTLLRLMFDWRVNILFLVGCVVAEALYLAGVRRLAHRHDVWPKGRTIAFTLGLLSIVLTTSSGLGRFSSASFSLHMILHMSLNMLGPLLLVMGGGVTLALRALPAAKHGGAAGPREWISWMLASSIARRIYNPLYVFVVFVGSYYVLYLTPIFQEALRYHWAHQVMNLHFVTIGYLFYSLAIGVDQAPRPLPYIGRLGLVLAAMPFHAFFGVIVMTSDTVIAKLFYQYLASPWATNLAGDQYLGGGIAWAAGELPLLVVVVALVTQWARQDARQAKRVDRHLDSGLDDSFDAYNAMLANLGRRDVTAPDGPNRRTQPRDSAGSVEPGGIPVDERMQS